MALTCGIFFGALVLAVYFPDVDAVFGLVGATSAVTLNFIVPAVLWRSACGDASRWCCRRNLPVLVLIAFGATLDSISCLDATHRLRTARIMRNVGRV